MERELPMKGLRALEPTESQLELSVCRYFEHRGLFFWKAPRAGFFDTTRNRFRKHVNPFVLNGTPDLIVVHQGRFIGVEIKTRAGKQTASQKAFEPRLRKAGGHYYTCRSLDDAENIFRALQLLPPP